MKNGLLSILFLGLACVNAQAELAMPQFTRQSVKIIQTVQPVFPLGVHELGYLHGDARVAISVDQTGRLTDHLVVEYSHPKFAQAAVEAIKQWRFEPALINGEPVSVRTEISINFEMSGVVISYDNNSYIEKYSNTVFRDAIAYRPCSMKEIDRIPTPLQAVKPYYSDDLAKQGIKGEVTVEFYIDETGALRLPAVLQSAHPALANLAMSALMQWKFEPPTRKGKPVLVRAKQVFNFNEVKR
ncbi:MAG: energy transducer TonB [Opitutae bacterium]|nr:energy transducer TonB [Opitutae bacterium]